MRRIGHLLNSVSFAKRTQVLTDHPGEFSLRTGTLSGGWTSKEVFEGYVDANLQYQPAGSPAVLYLSQCDCHKFTSTMFSFHSDELCAHHISKVERELTMGGACSGDPHIRTMNDVRYDFQAVGEFVLLSNNADFEVQARMSPVEAQRPIKNAHTGLTTCVSLTTSAAARVGRHVLSFQPRNKEFEGDMVFYLDGKPVQLTANGIDLGDGSRVIGFDANGRTGVRIDYGDGAVVRFTPHFWNKFMLHYINVSIARARATEGVMGFIPDKSWLPRLRDGTDLGARPSDLGDRWKQLYHVFAPSWRIDQASSLFIYESGLGAIDFSDPQWPREEPPCEVKPDLALPNSEILEGMDVKKAKRICAPVTLGDLNEACVFDVATTGDPVFANAYLLEQELRLQSTHIHIDVSEGAMGPTDYVATIRVIPEMPDRPKPAGIVVLYINDVKRRHARKLNARGVTTFKLKGFDRGEYKIRAEYIGDERVGSHGSVSATVTIRSGVDHDRQKTKDGLQKPNELMR